MGTVRLPTAPEPTRFLVKDDVIHLSGPISEFTRFRVLAHWRKDLKLNFRHVTEISGLGVRRLLEFLREWGERPLEYHDCPVVFVAYLAEVRGLMGAKEQAKVFADGRRLTNLHAFLAGHRLPPSPEPNTLEAVASPPARPAQELTRSDEGRAMLFQASVIPAELPKQSTDDKRMADEASVDVVTASQIARRIEKLALEDGYPAPEGSFDLRGWLTVLTKGSPLGERS